MYLNRALQLCKHFSHGITEFDADKEGKANIKIHFTCEQR